MRLAVLALGLALLLAGCASRAPEEASTVDPAVAPPARAMDWTPGNWWAYRATIGNESVDVALILHEKRADGYQLGSNLSVGFFGLPFHGNVTPDRNPRIGGDVWPLFRFPLADGKEWGYSLFGYDAKSVATRGDVAVPGLGALPGYHLEARSLGQVFARYTYSDAVGWFTHLRLIEPTNGSTVLEATLTAYGPDWQSAYYIEETIAEVKVPYPALPGALEVRVPPGYVNVRLDLTAHTAAGALFGTLRDERGRSLADVDVVAQGFDTERAAVDASRGATWTLEHRGAGTGVLLLHVTGLSASGPLAQITRPAVPQDGQTTSTGPPVGVYAIDVPQLGQRVDPLRVI